MPKKSNKQIEKDEKKVINELQTNARESINVIAQKLGMSRQKVWKIIKKLEKNKTIWGFCTILDDKKLNLNRYLMLIQSSPKPIFNLIDKISNLPLQMKGKEIGINIQSGGFINGIYDWVIVFTAKDMNHANKFKELLLKEYSSILTKVVIMEYIFQIKLSEIENPDVKKLKDYFMI